MRVTEDELIDIWRYFQYCCLPSILMAKYAYHDYLKNIQEEKSFYKFEIKHEINKVGKQLDLLPNKLMAISRQNERYMNILSSNIDELLEENTEELYKSIYISFRNAKFKHIDCFSALHYISAMLQISSCIFFQCCKDMQKIMGKDPTKGFGIYNLKEYADIWNTICDKATKQFGYLGSNKKASSVDLNNPRCTKAVHCIRAKYSNVDTLTEALRRSYPWSLNYKEGIPFEESADYLIVNSNNQKVDKCD